MNRITQEQAAFYILYKEAKKDREKYHSPSIVDIGDVLITELDQWAFTSWKAPARLSDIWNDNPGLLERIEVKSMTGSKYYKYRISIKAHRGLIKDEKLLSFYDRIKLKESSLMAINNRT